MLVKLNQVKNEEVVKMHNDYVKLLSSPLFGLIIQELAMQRDKLIDGKDNGTLVSLGEIRGYTQCINHIRTNIIRDLQGLIKNDEDKSKAPAESARSLEEKVLKK